MRRRSVAVYDAGLRETLGNESAAMSRGQGEALAPMVERVMGQVEGGFRLDRPDRRLRRPGLVHRHPHRPRDGARDGARARRFPLIGVSAHRAFAGPLLADTKPGVIAAAIDAKHGQVYFQLFDSERAAVVPAARRQAARRRARDWRRASAAGRQRARSCWPKRRSAPGANSTRRKLRPIPISSRSRAWARCRSRHLAAAPALYQSARRAPRRSGDAIAARRRLSGRSVGFLAAQAHALASCGRCGTEYAEDCAAIHATRLRPSLVRGGVRFAAHQAPTAIGTAAIDPATFRLRGFALSRLAADEAEILTIAVAPAWRKRGVGRDLLREHLQQVARAGGRKLFLEVDAANAAAVALYQRFRLR